MKFKEKLLKELSEDREFLIKVQSLLEIDDLEFKVDNLERKVNQR